MDSSLLIETNYISIVFVMLGIQKTLYRCQKYDCPKKMSRDCRDSSEMEIICHSYRWVWVLFPASSYKCSNMESDVRFWLLNVSPHTWHTHIHTHTQIKIKYFKTENCLTSVRHSPTKEEYHWAFSPPFGRIQALSTEVSNYCVLAGSESQHPKVRAELYTVKL